MENRDTNRNLFTGVYRSTVHKSPNDPLADEGINKRDIYPDKGNYYVLKRTEILICTRAWMNLEDITLSGISQTQKDKHYMIALR